MKERKKNHENLTIIERIMYFDIPHNFNTPNIFQSNNYILHSGIRSPGCVWIFLKRLLPQCLNCVDRHTWGVVILKLKVFRHYEQHLNWNEISKNEVWSFLCSRKRDFILGLRSLYKFLPPVPQKNKNGNSVFFFRYRLSHNGKLSC